jgi:hypothetical protein
MEVSWKGDRPNLKHIWQAIAYLSVQVLEKAIASTKMHRRRC